MKSFIVRLCVIAFLVVFSASVQAIPLFLTAQDIGLGKSEIAGYWGTDHHAQGFNSTGSTYLDRQDLNFRYLYGLADRIDIFAMYSFDSYPNWPSYGKDMEVPGIDVTTKVDSANTYGLGLKWTYLKANEGYPIDIAFMLGYQNSSASYTIQSAALAAKTSWTEGYAGWSASSIFSKKIRTFTPYLALGYGQVNTSEFKFFLGGKYPSIPETTILINLGVECELPNDLSAVLEYQFENIWWERTANSDWIIGAGQTSHCGFYMGLKYKF